MSGSKANVLEKLERISDDMSEMEIVERLYVLMRLEHSKKRCETEGVYSDAEVEEHFRRKKEWQQFSRQVKVCYNKWAYYVGMKRINGR